MNKPVPIHHEIPLEKITIRDIVAISLDESKRGKPDAYYITKKSILRMKKRQ